MTDLTNMTPTALGTLDAAARDAVHRRPHRKHIRGHAGQRQRTV